MKKYDTPGLNKWAKTAIEKAHKGDLNEFKALTDVMLNLRFTISEIVEVYKRNGLKPLDICAYMMLSIEELIKELANDK